MKCNLIIYLAAALLPASAIAADSCFQVTAGGERVFHENSTAAERKAAHKIGAAGGYCRTIVPDGTPGAIDADQAAKLLPEVRSYLVAAAKAEADKAKAAKVNAAKPIVVKAAKPIVPVKAVKPAAKSNAKRPSTPRARPSSAPAPAAGPVMRDDAPIHQYPSYERVEPAAPAIAPADVDPLPAVVAPIPGPPVAGPADNEVDPLPAAPAIALPADRPMPGGPVQPTQPCAGRTGLRAWLCRYW